MAGPRGSKRARGLGRGGDNKGRRGGTGRGATGGRGEDRGSQAGAEASNENAVTFDRPEPFTEEAAVNYSVLNLDDATTAHRTWRMTIFKYRLWCFNTTDKRFRFGHDDRLSCMLPEAGNFLVYVHFHGKWMCTVIDCPTGYLNGFITRSLDKDKRIQENKTKIPEGLSKEKLKEIRSQLPKYIEHADMLPWQGNYVYAATCLLGHMGLQNSFTTMYRHLEGLQIFDDADVTKAGEHFIVHIPEAGRSDVLFQNIDTSFVDGVNRMGKALLGDAQRWSVRTEEAFGIMVDVSPDRWTLKNHGKSSGHEIKRVEEKSFPPEVEDQLLIIEDVRLYYREYPNIRRFSLKDLPVDLGPWGPVNNKLNGLLDLGSKDFTHVLIKPFLKFQRAVNDNTTSGKNRGNESLVEENTKSSFDNHNAKSYMIKEVDKLSNSPDTQQFTYGCNVSTNGMLRKYKKAEVKHGCAGLLNSGNACFANSVLQYLHCIPELKAALVRYFKEGMNDELIDQASMKLTKAVCDLFGLLDHSADAVSPENLLKKLEERHAMYEQREWGLRRQQDAGEFLLQLMGTLSETLITKGDNIMNMLFGVNLFGGSETLSVNHLNCRITPEVNGLLEGLALYLQGENSSINKLPRYLIINLERVELDEMTCQSAKNFGKLDYPHQLDVYHLCSDELKRELEENMKVSGSNLKDSRTSDIDKEREWIGFGPG